MQYWSSYESPFGTIIMAVQDQGLCGLWFEDQKYACAALDKDAVYADHEILELCRQWLELYFQGQEPNLQVPLNLQGTPFQKAVWNQLLTIPFGTTVTYKDIALQTCRQLQSPHPAFQAVGRAIGRNPVSILVPCHRVIGSDGTLRGYAGGLKRKQALLDLEHAKMKPSS